MLSDLGHSKSKIKLVGNFLPEWKNGAENKHGNGKSPKSGRWFYWSKLLRSPGHLNAQVTVLSAPKSVDGKMVKRLRRERRPLGSFSRQMFSLFSALSIGTSHGIGMRHESRPSASELGATAGLRPSGCFDEANRVAHHQGPRAGSANKKSTKCANNMNPKDFRNVARR